MPNRHTIHDLATEYGISTLTLRAIARDASIWLHPYNDHIRDVQRDMLVRALNRAVQRGAL